MALTMAETGHLVFATLHTTDAAQTVDRIIDVFPVSDQAEIRTRLALNLRSVISQVLMRRKDIPGRIAAREVLFVNNSVSNLIREGKIHQIDNVCLQAVYKTAIAASMTLQTHLVPEIMSHY